VIGPDDDPGIGGVPTASNRSMVDLGIDGLDGAELIGVGGFGAVYRVSQPSLNRVVAVKVLTAPLDGAAQDRFEREAFAMGTVAGHPNIVQVISTGTTASGRPYLLMPYIGRSLDHLTPVPWPTAVRYGIKLSGALATAHAAGVLHRDLKPANVLVSEFGEPLIADFGIARVSSGFRTATGVVTASVPFAPPEILEGRPPTVAADVYSLAATVHALISSSAPFAARPEEELVATYLRISRDPPPDLRPLGVPELVCRALESALAKDPTKRPASAAAFGELLQRAQRAAGQPVTTMPVASPVSPILGIDVDQGTTQPDGTGPQDRTVPPAVTLVATATQTAPMHGATTQSLPTPTVPGSRSRRRLFLVLGLVAVLVIAGILLRPDDPGASAEQATGTGSRSTTRSTPTGQDTPTGAPTRTTPSVPAIDQVDKPVGLALTAAGDLLICDADRHQVVRLGRDGRVSVVAGDGTSGDSGNGGPATAARLSFPSAVATTDAGEIYVATAGTVRRIDARGTIGPVAGLPPGFGVVRIAAAGDGTLYLASKTTILVRSRNGAVSTLAAEVGDLSGLTVHPEGGVAVSDISRNQVLWIDAQGRSTRIAGLGSKGGDPRQDGLPAQGTALADPTGLAFDRAGRLYVTEAGNNRIRTVEPDGTMRTVAGNPDSYSAGDTGDGGPGPSATFQLLDGPLVVARDGTLYIGDVLNRRVRKLDATGVHPVA